MAYLGARKRTTRQASSQAVNRRRSEGGPRAWFASIDWNSVRFRTVAVLFFVVWGALWVRAGPSTPALDARFDARHVCQYPLATIPGAVFSVWHNISGAVLANFYARTADKQ